MDTKIVGERIAALLKSRNMKQVEYSALTGFTTKHISNIVRGMVGSIPDETLDVLAKPLGVDRFYLQGIEKNPAPITVNVFTGKMPLDKLDKKSMSFIPLMSTKAAATPAVLEVSDGQTDGGIYVPAEIVNKHDDVRAYTVFGNSMNTDLQDGDIVAVAHYTFPPDLYSLDRNKIYLCNIEDWLGIGYTLKRARIVNGRYLNLISDNKEYDPMILDLYDENRTYLPIAGHVVWMSRKF